MVSNELNQILNGGAGYFRDRAPEPLLIPRIASRIAPEQLGYIASTARTLSAFWMSGGWPAIADATAQAIASRHAELGDDLLHQLCDELPGLPLALIEQDSAAGQRAETVFGRGAANRLREGLGNPAFLLREAVSRVFDEGSAPSAADDLMVFIRERAEHEGPELQRNVLAYFLPQAPAAHRQWMVPILIDVLGTYPDWSVAAAASRIAGLLDQGALEQLIASLMCEEPWASHVASLLQGGAAGSVFGEVARAFPFDNRLVALLASETEPGSFSDVTDNILYEWGGAPPTMAASPGLESVDSGSDDRDSDAGSDEAPAPRSVSRGFDPFGTDDEADNAPPASSSRSIPQPSPAAKPVPERRLQARVQVSIEDDGYMETVRQGFMKGATHEISLWIGPDSKRSIKSDRTLSEPSPDAQEQQAGFMEITITMLHDSKIQTRKVGLPVDRTKPSKKAKFSLEVADDAQFVSAEIWLQHKGRVIQYSKINGLALEEPFENVEGIKLKVESLIRNLPVDSSGTDFGMAVVQKDNKYIVFGPAGSPAEVSLTGSGELVEELNKDLFKSTMRLVRRSEQNNGETWVENQNEEALNFLRKLATRGNLFYQELKKQGVLDRFSETIQFVNLDSSDIVPIEYVYDRGYPKVARLCKGFRDSKDWNEIFAAGKCTCSDGPEEEPKPICPMGFWSLSKVIERQSVSRGKPPAASAGLVQPSGATPPIELDRHALLAAAPNVNSEDVESIEATLGTTYPDRFAYASGWDDWKEKIEKSSPKLLVLLPHHGESEGADTDFLEIKSTKSEYDSKLFSGELNEDHVSVNPDEPGPIVLLLGCETAESGLLPYSRFARDFLSNRASIVVGTQASILGRHAAEAANEFIKQLLTTVDGDQSFGRVMRKVRQKMFASGHLMSLTLVSFGDADWKLEKGTNGERNVSH